MRVYRTVLVEDEGPARRRLETMINTHQKLVLHASLKSGREALANLEVLQPEILLMDIELKDKNAFEVLDMLHKRIQCKIIFVTAYDFYAVKAFEVNAIDYLLKPYNQERFNTAIEKITEKEHEGMVRDYARILQSALKTGTDKVYIPEGNKNHLINAKDISHIRSDRYYCNVWMNTEKRLVRITLKKLEKLLPSNFIRINKSVIINTEWVVQIEYQKQSGKVKLKTGDVFPCSKIYYPGLKTFFGKVV